MNQIIGFIGCGNMAQAMIKGIITEGSYGPEDIYVSDPNSKALSMMRENHGVVPSQNNVPVAQAADIIFLSVKPNLYKTVIDEIKDVIKPDALVIMIAAGQTIEANEAQFNKPVKLIRAMPNTPAMVGEGMTAICTNKHVTKEEESLVLEIFRSFGKAELVSESLFSAIIGISGSSPAYAFMFIEALADSGVAAGLPRQQAYTFAAQSLLGSAKMVLKTNKHPGELKDMVCSPGGTTIDAVAELENSGFRSSVIKAVKACVDKADLMTK